MSQNNLEVYKCILNENAMFKNNTSYSIFKHNIYCFYYKKIETNHNLQTYKKNVDA